MRTRLELQSKFEDMLGSDQVYYKAPENIKMTYPAIVYKKSKIDVRRANNKVYLKRNRYEITVIDRRPDNPVIDKILELPYSSYDRTYVSDNLHHDSITLYW